MKTEQKLKKHSVLYRVGDLVFLHVLYRVGVRFSNRVVERVRDRVHDRVEARVEDRVWGRVEDRVLSRVEEEGQR